MKTYFGVDYHKKFSHGTIMNEKGTILKQGRFNNNKQCIEKFLGDFMGNSCCSVLEATRNWMVVSALLSSRRFVYLNTTNISYTVRFHFWNI
jgi:hypothetical protein